MDCDILQATEQEIAPELQLIAELSEVGLTIPITAYGNVVAILSEWILRHQAATQARAFDHREAAAKILFLCSRNKTASPLMAGYFVYCLMHKLRLGDSKTQTELSRQLDVTEGYVSQLLKELNRALPL